MTTFTARAASFVCTLVLSATCILSAVGPATAAGQHQTVASTVRFMA